MFLEGLLPSGKSPRYDSQGLHVHSGVGNGTLFQSQESTPDESTTMKHNHNNDNARSAAQQLVPVRFEFTHPTASTVSVAGTFNDWHPTTKSMHLSGNSHWLQETALAPGA